MKVFFQNDETVLSLPLPEERLLLSFWNKKFAQRLQSYPEQFPLLSEEGRENLLPPAAIPTLAAALCEEGLLLIAHRGIFRAIASEVRRRTGMKQLLITQYTLDRCIEEITAFFASCETYSFEQCYADGMVFLKIQGVPGKSFRVKPCHYKNGVPFLMTVDDYGTGFLDCSTILVFEEDSLTFNFPGEDIGYITRKVYTKES